MDYWNFIKDAKLTEDDMLELSNLLDKFATWMENEYEEELAEEYQ